MNVIGLKGKARVGKSTAANYLMNRGYTRTAFAGPLKLMLTTLLCHAGVHPDEAERMVSGDLKEVPTEILSGRTPREAMQTLGTEWGRSLHPDFWVNIWKSSVERYRKLGALEKVCVDDMRFPNEAKAVREMGGFVIEIVPSKRDALESVGIGGHVSESLDFDPDIVVINDGKSLTRYASDLNDALHVLSQEAAE